MNDYSVNYSRLLRKPSEVKGSIMSFRDIALFIAACCALSSLAGLTCLIRSKLPLTLRSVAGAILWNGVAGFSMATLGYHFLGDGNRYLLIGMCALAGIGSVSVLEFCWQFVNGRIGVHISIEREDLRDQARRHGSDIDSD